MVVALLANPKITDRREVEIYSKVFAFYENHDEYLKARTLEIPNLIAIHGLGVVKFLLQTIKEPVHFDGPWFDLAKDFQYACSIVGSYTHERVSEIKDGVTYLGSSVEAKVLSKNKIIPIRCPFKKTGTSRWREMDISFEMDDDNITGWIRMVNHIKYPDGSFCLHGDASRSVSYELSGKISDPDNLKYQELFPMYNRQTYSTFWYGVERIRPCENGLYVVVPELTQGSHSKLFKTNRQLTKFEDTDLDKSSVLYPQGFMTKESIQKDVTFEVNTSSNGIDFKDGFLFVVTTGLNRFMYLKDGEKKFGKPFKLFSWSFSETISSICLKGDKLWMGVGVNEEETYLVEVNVPEF